MKVEKLPDGQIKICPRPEFSSSFTLTPELALHLAAICGGENKARIHRAVAGKLVQRNA